MRSFSRRQFLGASVAALSMASATPRAFGAACPLRIGLVGCGARGTELLQACAKHPALRVAAVSDAYEPRRRAASALSDARQVEDWRRLVTARDVDAVIIATPDHWHAPMAIAAMEAGKDVYCERPMALNLQEAKAFRDCAAATGRVVQIGAESAAQGQWAAMRRVVESGAIGTVTWAQGAYHRRSVSVPCETSIAPADLNWDAFQGAAPCRPLDEGRFAGWRGYWDYSAGLAAEHHFDDLVGLLLATGEDYPSHVSAAGGVYATDGREVPDSLALTAHYPSGTTFVLASGMAGLVEAPAVVRGLNGSVSALDTAIEIDTDGSANSHREPVAPTGSLLADWVAAIETRGSCLCTPDLGYKAMVVLSLAADAYRSGKAMAYSSAHEAGFPREHKPMRA